MRRVLCRLVEEVVAVGQVMFEAGGRRGERGRNAFRVVHLEGAIDFVRRNMVEALAFVLFREAFPVELRGLQQAQSPHHVRLRECKRILDGAIDMAFCRQVDDSVDMFVLHELVERVEVADVHLHELVVRLVLYVLEVREVARVGKLIEVDNLVFRVLVHEQANHVAPNKAGTASNNDILHTLVIPASEPGSPYSSNAKSKSFKAGFFVSFSLSSGSKPLPTGHLMPIAESFHIRPPSSFGS